MKASITYNGNYIPEIDSTLYYIEDNLKKVVTGEVQAITIEVPEGETEPKVVLDIYSYKLFKYYESFLNAFILKPSEVETELNLKLTEQERNSLSNSSIQSYCKGCSKYELDKIYRGIAKTVFNTRIKDRSNVYLDLSQVYLSIEQAEAELLNILALEHELESNELLNRYKNA